MTGAGKAREFAASTGWTSAPEPGSMILFNPDEAEMGIQSHERQFLIKPGTSACVSFF
jgi:hypothetical protein